MATVLGRAHASAACLGLAHASRQLCSMSDLAEAPAATFLDLAFLWRPSCPCPPGLLTRIRLARPLCRQANVSSEPNARLTLFYSVTMPGDVEPQAREAAAGNDHVAVQLVPRDNGGAFINALHRAKRNPKLRIDNVRRSKNLAMVMNRCKKQWAGLLDDLPMLFYLHPSGERLEDTTTIESLCRLNNVSLIAVRDVNNPY